MRHHGAPTRLLDRTRSPGLDGFGRWLNTNVTISDGMLSALRGRRLWKTNHLFLRLPVLLQKGINLRIRQHRPINTQDGFSLSGDSITTNFMALALQFCNRLIVHVIILARAERPAPHSRPYNRRHTASNSDFLLDHQLGVGIPVSSWNAGLPDSFPYQR
jgi:hypothetical protein